jgi:hypothetical protein
MRARNFDPSPQRRLGDTELSDDLNLIFLAPNVAGFF